VSGRLIGEPTDPTRRAFAPWIVVVLALAVHLWGLYTTSPPDAGALSFPGIDKVAHVVLFAVPTWALLRVVPNQWFALVPMLLHVPVSELVQANVLANRGGEWWDAVAGLVGVAVGWWTVQSQARMEGTPVRGQQE